MATPEPPEYIILTGAGHHGSYAAAIMALMSSCESAELIPADTRQTRVVFVDDTSYRPLVSASLVAELTIHPTRDFFQEEPKAIPYCPVNTFNARYKSLRQNNLVRRFNPRNDRLINKRKTYLKRASQSSL